MPRAASESATANGMAPPPAITPTGDEMSEAADVMAAAVPSSLSAAAVGRKTERAMLAVADEGRGFPRSRDRRRPAAAPRSAVRQRCRGRETAFDRTTRTVASRSLVNLRRFMPMMLRPSSAAYWPLTRPNGMTSPRTPQTPPTITCGPIRVNWCTADRPPMIDEIADLAMAAERGRGRKDHVVADHGSHGRHGCSS